MPGCSGLQVTIAATSASQALTGTAGDDVIAGLGGNDGGLDNDTLLGRDGVDLLNGDNGADSLAGGAGSPDICRASPCPTAWPPATAANW